MEFQIRTRKVNSKPPLCFERNVKGSFKTEGNPRRNVRQANPNATSASFATGLPLSADATSGLKRDCEITSACHPEVS